MIRFFIYQNQKNRPPGVPAVQMTADAISAAEESGDSASQQRQQSVEPDIIPEFPFTAEQLTVQQRNAIYRAANGNVERYVTVMK